MQAGLFFPKLSLVNEMGKYIGETSGSYPWRHIQGTGAMTFNSGDRYEGEWSSNCFHGHGILRCADGRVYEGKWDRACIVWVGAMLDLDNSVWSTPFSPDLAVAAAKKCNIFDALHTMCKTQDIISVGQRTNLQNSRVTMVEMAQVKGVGVLAGRPSAESLKKDWNGVWKRKDGLQVEGTLSGLRPLTGSVKLAGGDRAVITFDGKHTLAEELVELKVSLASRSPNLVVLRLVTALQNSMFMNSHTVNVQTNG